CVCPDSLRSIIVEMAREHIAGSNGATIFKLAIVPDTPPRVGDVQGSAVNECAIVTVPYSCLLDIQVFNTDTVDAYYSFSFIYKDTPEVFNPRCRCFHVRFPDMSYP